MEKIMPTIEVDFEVFKALTARRESEEVTNNDVIRRLLKLGALTSPVPVSLERGATYKGVFFPDATQFRATYKGRAYLAEIKNGSWVGSDGAVRNSPSEAAVKITGKNWNGWRFWY
jgi:hypothetical protein